MSKADKTSIEKEQKIKQSKRRALAFYIILVVLFAALSVRMGKISTGTRYTAAAARQSSYTLRVAQNRGTIYDRNMKPLVNRSSRYILAVVPTPEAITALKKNLGETNFLSAAGQMNNGKPMLISSEKAVDDDDIISFTIPIRNDSEQIAEHFIGYTDSSGKGVAGIEAAFNDLLSGQYGGEISVSYNINALGEAIGSQSGHVTDTCLNPDGGVVLTIDRELQQILEQQCTQIQSGAAVMMRVDTGEIVAACSFPGFDVTDVAAVLNDDSSPLYNRIMAAYNVGSIFKICVAAAAIENGVTADYCYNCPGYYELGDRRFYCHLHSGHGELTMEEAIEQSCNPYFINLGQMLGASKILTMAKKLGFGESYTLAQGISSSAGSLPESENITKGELANLSFGQGVLTATPLQLCAMLCTTANGGMSVTPSLVTGTTNDGANIVMVKASKQKRIFSEYTAKLLQEMLIETVNSGTGQRAASQYVGTAGKTSSAQTGQYVEGVEIVHAWFAGFFPTDTPKYALVIISEGGEAGGKIPAAIFSSVCDAVTLMENPLLRKSAGE